MILAKFAEGISNKDMGLLESLLHDEFLFVEETTLETKEEWLRETRKMLDDGRIDASKHDITAKFETKDMGAIELIREEDGTWVRVLNIVLYKNNKICRHMINKVDIEH